MTRERLHAMVDLILDYSYKAKRVGFNGHRIEIVVEDTEEYGRIWIHHHIGSDNSTVHQYYPFTDRFCDSRDGFYDHYDPDYTQAEAHIRKMIAIVDQIADLSAFTQMEEVTHVNII